ncbi:bifunctional methionine sulfoxide reductase B/A protein [Candidatus Fermentibacteria bacterium]|nr:bifunctional methionine sulfoxide reductase B/A protein [Candidatus Fermentibacteria bacterium]
MRQLTAEEARVILQKGTERAFTGEYWDHHEDGTYRCRQCGATLFSSGHKFDSGCGWPSFDDAEPGAVKEVPDADGRRTEIVCAACGGHLGHVFRGEGLTPADTRHCVNSISMTFEPASPPSEKAYFAGGCFWGVEFWFEKEPGVSAAVSGYMGGGTERPSYAEVCSGTTGHVESVEVTFDPTVVSYETLARLFFEIHDPTQVERQGPDVGTQYRSVVFYASDEQRQVAESLIARLEERGYNVATRLEPATTFWRAEDYHQDYYTHKGSTPYCHARVRRFSD